MQTINNTARLGTIKQMRMYKDKAESYHQTCRILVMVVAALLGSVIGLMIHNVKVSSKLNDAMANYNKASSELSTLQENYDTLLLDYCQLRESAGTMAKSLNSMKAVVDELDEDNAKLMEDNKELSTKLAKFEERAELYDKYEYAVYDKAGNRTDLTYDQIKTGEELMIEQGIDPDLLFGTIMVESGGDENATNGQSTARGFGQFLAGSGKYVYEDIMGNGKGTYTHDMAFNGYTNISMIASYYGYLRNDRHYSAYQAIKRYRGLEPTAYIRAIDSYICKSGDSIAKISAKW